MFPVCLWARMQTCQEQPGQSGIQESVSGRKEEVTIYYSFRPELRGWTPLVLLLIINY